MSRELTIINAHRIEARCIEGLSNQLELTIIEKCGKLEMTTVVVVQFAGEKDELVHDLAEGITNICSIHDRPPLQGIFEAAILPFKPTAERV